MKLSHCATIVLALATLAFAGCSGTDSHLPPGTAAVSFASESSLFIDVQGTNTTFDDSATDCANTFAEMCASPDTESDPLCLGLWSFSGDGSGGDIPVYSDTTCGDEIASCTAVTVQLVDGVNDIQLQCTHLSSGVTFTLNF